MREGSPQFRNGIAQKSHFARTTETKHGNLKKTPGQHRSRQLVGRADRTNDGRLDVRPRAKRPLERAS